MTIVSSTIGNNPLRKNGVVLLVNKKSKMQYYLQSQKQRNDHSLFPRQTIQYQSIPSLCPNH